MIRRFLASLAAACVVILVSSSAQAQLSTYTFATLPASPAAGTLAWISDGSGAATVGSPAAGGGANRDLVAYDGAQTRWEFVSRVNLTTTPADLDTYLDAVRVAYDNGESGATADDVQEALDELFAAGGVGATNLGNTPGASSVTVTSSTGSSTVLPAATTSLAGMQTAADKTKLNGIEAGATADQISTEVPFTSTFAAWTAANVRVALDNLYEWLQRADADGDGLFEVAYLWDADGDGSSKVVCTGNATPDIACGTAGEVVYRDAIDDLNCATFGCGFGQSEIDGTIILGGGVMWLGFPCWDATTPGNHTPENAETNDQHHDQTSDPAFANCPVDPDGKSVKVLALRDWQGTITGEGADTRRLERGSLSASLRRDRGTYFFNDMGPWDQSTNDNVWFGGGDQERMISTGFTTNTTDPNHPNGGSATDDASSKGWWRVALNVDFTTWVTDDQILCLQNTGGGGAGVDFKTSGTVSSLVAGDELIVPVKTTPTGSYNTFKVVVRSTPSVACGTGGLWVTLGGSEMQRDGPTKVFPPHATTITAADNVRVLHPRSNYENTRARITNMRVGPLDPWNEFGGRCTNSGTAWKATVTSLGTPWSQVTDDSNTDLSCDTLPLFGLWGGGRVEIDHVVVANSHKYAFDAGGTGLVDLEDITYLYGNGGELADVSNGWRLHNFLIDKSHFISAVFNIFGFAPQFDGITLRNSFFGRVLTLDAQSPRALVENIRNEGNAFVYTIGFGCGALQSTVRNIMQTGRGGNALGGNSPAAIYLECDVASTPITQNVIENVVVDGMDTAQGGETAPVVLFNVPAASGNSADAQWSAIIGNTFRGMRSTGYVGGTAGESACLYAVGEADADSPADDDGESVIFTKNWFEGGSVEANGRVFCMTNIGTPNINTTAIDSTGAATPAWGDPQGCGNMDGGTVYADENCQ